MLFHKLLWKKKVYSYMHYNNIMEGACVWAIMQGPILIESTAFMRNSSRCIPRNLLRARIFKATQPRPNRAHHNRTSQPQLARNQPLYTVHCKAC